jgi:L-lactate dehydrogenase complex protein LldG
MALGDSDQARADILARIRKAQGRGPERPSPSELEAIETYLRARPRGPLRELGGDPVSRFRTEAESMQSTTEEVAAEADAPEAVARYLRRQQLPLRGCVWPALAHIDWRTAGLDLAPRAATGDDPVGVTGAFAALAETGTLMLVSGPDTPQTVSLLPETHIALVPASRVVACMEDAWALARHASGELPRAVNFVSGPSRTGDIEQIMVMGVHGPYRVHIIIVRSA